MEHQGLEKVLEMRSAIQTTQDDAGLTANHGNRSATRRLKGLSLQTKLAIGFGILVALTFLAAGMSYLGSFQATRKINLTDEVRVPAAMAASRAQANLLRMQNDVRGYLALGDEEYKESYEQSNEDFEKELAALEKLSPGLTPQNLSQLKELRVLHRRWLTLPEKLFELRDDQLDREPAYRLLATEGTQLAGSVLISLDTLIESQAQRKPTRENIQILGEMARFQGAFAAIFFGLRGYVTTRNRIYRQEFEVNQTAGGLAWDTLSGRASLLDQSQQEAFANIAKKRQEFLDSIPRRVFDLLEGERWREDLYLFRTEAMPLALGMQRLLNEMTDDQQRLLKEELAEGRQDLSQANALILAGGLLGLVFSMLLATLVSKNIAGPILRLTGVAERIRSGELAARAPVESADEIGVLAQTFNAMTNRLQETFDQVRREKKRADGLLDVVIPIGVQLSSEKDFNRLLENMLVEAKGFCGADAGILYLRDEDNRLTYVIVRNDSRHIALGGATGRKITLPSLPLVDPATSEPNHRMAAAHAALEGVSVNLTRSGEDLPFDLARATEALCAGAEDDYRIESLLSIPLKNSDGKVLGVLELLNAGHTEAVETDGFDINLQELMESFSLLAGAALEGYIRVQSLRQEIQQLRIEIDEAKRHKQVSEIVDSEFFKDLTAKARTMRKRSRDDTSKR